MAIAATVVYFGQHPTTIVLKSNTNFNGAAMTGAAVLSPGLYTFPEQAGGGLFNFHDEPIDIKNISFGAAAGTLTITHSVGGKDILLATLTPSAATYSEDLTIAPGESLKFSSAGTTASPGSPAVVAITSQLTSGAWAT